MDTPGTRIWLGARARRTPCRSRRVVVSAVAGISPAPAPRHAPRSGARSRSAEELARVRRRAYESAGATRGAGRGWRPTPGAAGRSADGHGLPGLRSARPAWARASRSARPTPARLKTRSSGTRACSSPGAVSRPEPEPWPAVVASVGAHDARWPGGAWWPDVRRRGKSRPHHRQARTPGRRRQPAPAQPAPRAGVCGGAAPRRWRGPRGRAGPSSRRRRAAPARATPRTRRR
jgi:hypothetical protein